MAKSFTPTPDQVAAAETVFACMAMVATVRPIVEGYQRRILAEIGWGHLPLEQTYEMPDAAFQVYHDRCCEERDRANLSVDDPAKCPLLVAGHLKTLAEQVLVDSLAPMTNLTWDSLLCSGDGLASLREYVDLSLRLLAPYFSNRLGKDLHGGEGR